jgi:hypothetical protein
MSLEKLVSQATDVDAIDEWYNCLKRTNRTSSWGLEVLRLLTCDQGAEVSEASDCDQGAEVLRLLTFD